MYQNPNVLIVDVIACASPRYVFWRKLKENLSFWQIATSVPVVLRPWRFREVSYVLEVAQRRQTYIGQKEE